MSTQTDDLRYIPLNQLIASPRNVRRKDRKADIDALAASIAAQGLLQNLCVVAADDGKYEVDAGGRRLSALKQLAKAGLIPRNHPVRCQVIAMEQGREASLTENIHRVAMDAMDEVDAYALLVSGGLTADAVAQRFGVTRRHVDQRLALAGLSPRIKSAWKKGDVSLEAARAFCLVPDHAQQDAVFKSLGKPVTHAGSVRARMTDGRIRASDPTALFVGLDAYQAAGGRVLQDLFDEDMIFLEDPALLTQLADTRLQQAYAPWLALGWSWVDHHIGSTHADGLSHIRLYAGWRNPTAEEQAELDRLAAEIAALDAQLEDSSTDDDERWSRKDDLEAAYETIRQAARCWSPDAMQVSGVLLTLDHRGQLRATEGVVRSSDQKLAAAFLKGVQTRTQDSGPATSDAYGQSSRERLPKSLAKELSTLRTRIIRRGVSENADVALAVCVASLARRSLLGAEMPGVGISAHLWNEGDEPSLQASREALAQSLPRDVHGALTWALDQSRERLMEVLGILVASTITLSHENVSSADGERQAVADLLAQHLDIDMAKHWTPDLAFWLQLSKAQLLKVLEDTIDPDTPPAKRDAVLKTAAKDRKDVLAAKVAALHTSSGYLPEILVTPVAKGAFELTEAADDALKTDAAA